MASAAHSLVLDLQVGRRLRGRLLALVVLLREVPLAWVGLGGVGLAPAWVVVRERSTGEEVLRISAGRGAGAGEQLLSAMQREAVELDRECFLERWRDRT